MRAQVSLIPTESKKLIAKAVVGMDEVQNAYNNGIIAVHPSSSTIFIVEELIGNLPDTAVWVCGIIVPKAPCISLEAANRPRPTEDMKGSISTPASFSNTWVIENRELKEISLAGIQGVE